MRLPGASFSSTASVLSASGEPTMPARGYCGSGAGGRPGVCGGCAANAPWRENMRSVSKATTSPQVEPLPTAREAAETVTWRCARISEGQ